jgi:outer membrane protein assembly factor BamB
MYVDFYRFTTAGAIFGSPVVVDRTVYVGSTDGRLYALE